MVDLGCKARHRNVGQISCIWKDTKKSKAYTIWLKKSHISFPSIELINSQALIKVDATNTKDPNSRMIKGEVIVGL